MPRADFRQAILRNAGLADVQWEMADLREADLRNCSFHMGSSRSGLVGSPYPSHGTRTGFYTDTVDEQYYKRPEEIRKANLCGADLRGRTWPTRISTSSIFAGPSTTPIRPSISAAATRSWRTGANWTELHASSFVHLFSMASNSFC